MTISIRMLLLLCLVASTLLPGCTLLGSGPSWQKFSDAEAGFEVLMPGTPTKAPIAVPRENNIILSGFRFKLPVEDSRIIGLGYDLSYVDLPPDTPPTTGATLDWTMRETYKRVGTGKFLSKRLSTFAGHPSVDYEWKKDGSGIVYAGRAFHAHNRLYQAIATLTVAQHANGDADKFLQSFRMLK